MKTLLVFIFALCCFAFIQPSFASSWTWKDCGDGGKFKWLTTNVAFVQPPVIGQNVTAQICEDNTSDIIWEISGVLTQSVHSLDINVYFTDYELLRRGASHCWNVTFPIPEGVRPNLEVQTLFQNALGAAGCAQINFNFANSEKKFLSF